MPQNPSRPRGTSRRNGTPQPGAVADAQAAQQEAIQAALAALKAGDYAAVLRHCAPVLAAAPKSRAGNTFAGMAHLRRGEIAAARRHLTTAHEQAPENIEILSHLASAHEHDGAYGQAAATLRSVLAADLDTDKRRSRWQRLVANLRQAGAPKAALAEARAFEAALGPDLDITGQRARCCIDRRAFSAAVRTLVAGLGRWPAEAYLWHLLALACDQAGWPMSALAALERSLRRAGVTDSQYLFALHYHPRATPARTRAAAGHWARQKGLADRDAVPSPRFAAAEPERRLRVAFLSANFENHPTGFFTAGTLAALDRDALEVHAVAVTRRRDEMAQAVQAGVDHFHDLADESSDGVQAYLAQSGFDIIVDLSGYARHGTLHLLARRLAPIQAKWVGGQFSSTGMATIDYFVTDPVATPPGWEGDFSEGLIRLAGGYTSYRRKADMPAVSESPWRRRGVVTLGCFNKLAKICDATVALWAEILAARPEVRLMIKTTSLTDGHVRRQTRARFAAHGIAPERLRLEGHAPHHVLLESYGELDLALDPLVYSGGLTTVEALLMGVPVLTAPGRLFTARHAASRLAGAGLSDWCQPDPAAYRDAALALIDAPERLAEMRADLRPTVQAAPLCDGGRTARELTAALRTAWHRHCAGEAHDCPIEVTAPPDAATVSAAAVKAGTTAAPVSEDAVPAALTRLAEADAAEDSATLWAAAAELAWMAPERWEAAYYDARAWELSGDVVRAWSRLEGLAGEIALSDSCAVTRTRLTRAVDAALADALTSAPRSPAAARADLAQDTADPLAYVRYVQALTGEGQATAPADADALDRSLTAAGWPGARTLYRDVVTGWSPAVMDAAAGMAIILRVAQPVPDLPALVTSLRGQMAAEDRLVLLDHGAGPAAIAAARADADLVVTVSGWARAGLARNAAAVLSGGEALLFLDAPGRVAAGLLAGHKAGLAESGAVAVQGRLAPDLALAFRDDPPETAGAACALRHESNVAVDAAAFFAVGGWDPVMPSACGAPALTARLSAHGGLAGIRDGASAVYRPAEPPLETPLAIPDIAWAPLAARLRHQRAAQQAPGSEAATAIPPAVLGGPAGLPPTQPGAALPSGG